MICPKCGNQLAPSMKFCAKCGTPAPQPTVPQRPVQQKPATPVAPQKPVNQNTVTSQQSANEKPKAKKSVNVKKIAIIATSIVLVVAIALVGVFVLPGLIGGGEGNPAASLFGGSSSGEGSKTVKAVSKVTVIKNGEDYSCRNFSYDEKGLVKEIKTYMPIGEPYVNYTYKYNEKGLVTEEAMTDSTGLSYLKTLYKYDENGKLKQLYYASGEDEASLAEIYDSYGLSIPDGKYEYDSKGNIVKVTNYNATTGEVSSMTEYEYDANNRRTKCTNYPNKELFSSTETTIYDAEGRKIEKITKSYSDSNSGKKTTYKYNSKGSVVEIMRYYCTDGSTYHEEMRWSCEYDSDNKLVSASIYDYHDEENKSEYTFTYDNNGYLTEYTENDIKDGEIIKHVVEYSEITVNSTLSDDIIADSQEKIVFDILPSSLKV